MERDGEIYALKEPSRNKRNKDLSWKIVHVQLSKYDSKPLKVGNTVTMYCFGNTRKENVISYS